MLKKLLILLLIININCNSQNHILEKDWIMVSSKNIETGEISYSHIRERFSFKNNELRKTSLTVKSAIARNYKLSDNEIKFDSYNGNTQHYVNDSLVLTTKNETRSWGKIIEMNKDSLLIKHSDDFMSIYKPFKETRFSEHDAEVLHTKLIENVWEIKTKKDTIRIYCTDEAYGGIFTGMNWINSLSYEDTRIVSKFEQIHSAQYWGVDYFNGKILLVFSHGGTENQLLQITDIRENGIKGRLLHYFNSGDWETVEITPAFNEIGLKDIKEQDFIGDWSCVIMNKGKTRKYSSNSPITESFKTELIIKEPIYIQDVRPSFFEKNRLNLNDIRNDDITFKFLTNGEYEIKAGDKIIREGKNWGLTKDKKYLYLDGQTTSLNFIRITSFDNDGLKVEKLETVNIEVKNPNACFFVNLKLNLIKDNSQQ